MKYLIAMSLFIGCYAQANLLKETRTQDVNQNSVHLDCKLKSALASKFASYSRVLIKTDFGDDGPNASAYDDRNRLVESLMLSDFSEHPQSNMRIFALEDYKQKTMTHLIVIYSKSGSRIEASAVLTTNGRSYPSVVSNQEMVCEYIGRLAINN